MKRWGLGTYHGLRGKHIDTYLNEFVFRYNRRFYRHVSFETMLGLASHHHRQVTGISSDTTIPAKACRQSGASHGAAGQRPACRQTDQNLPKSRTQSRFGFDPPALDIDQPGTTG
jgi:hypothetical protein